MTGPVVHGVTLQPGDLLICDGTADTSKLIEIGAVLVGDPAASHVCAYTHNDKHGTPWGLEGRPGGFGWRDIRDYDADPRTITNASQPKTDAEREVACTWGVKLIGTRYGWVSGVLEDAAEALLPQWFKADAWKPEASGTVPAHVVCSSAWAWIYGKVGLAAPKPDDWQHVMPGDWAEFVAEQRWKHP